MGEYIEREAAVVKILKIGEENYKGKYPNIGMVHAAKIVKSIPSADVSPIVHGKWVKEVYIDPCGADWTKYHCSLCGRVEIKKEPYCNCGAMMDLEE